MSAAFALGAAASWWLLPHGGVVQGTRWWLVAVVLGLYLVVDQLTAPIEFGPVSLYLTLVELPLVVGLLCLPPWLVLAARVLVTVVRVTRSRLAPELVATNLTWQAWEVIVAVNAFSAMAATSLGRAEGHLAAAVVATATSTTFGVPMVMVVASRVRGGTVDRRAVVVAALGNLATSLITTIIAVGVVDLAGDNPLLMFGPVGVVLALLLVLRRYTVVEQRYQRTKGLYQFSSLLERTIDVGHAGAADILVQLTTLLSARRVDLVLETAHHGGDVVRLSSDGNGSVHGSLSPMERLLLSGPMGGPSLVLPTDGAEAAAELTRYDARQLIHVPLGQDGDAVGVLAVVDRPGRARNFGPADLELCEALAQHLGLWLTRAHLAERLHRELDLRDHQAHHDDLTGLPNRRQLARLLPDVIGAAAERLEHVAVVLIDLDRFKDVNDTLGHAAGDRLLVHVANRMARALPLGSLVARLGGDEFVVVLPPAGSIAGAMALAEQVPAAFQDRFSVDGVEVLVEASMGAVVAPEDGADIDSLLRRADVAMYEAKRNHTRLVRYVSALDPHSPDQLSVTAALQRGIETGELLMHFQPKIDLATGMVAGVEALVRWNRGHAELVPPDKFISQAEHSGLAGPLFTEVLNLSLAQARTWHNQGLVLGVAVNMSARNLADPDLAVVVGEALNRYHLPPGLVTLELTENAALANPMLAQQALARLLSLGVRIALDDFGTGHSSIRLLRDLPIQELKIDKSFVGAMRHDADAYAIVGNLTRLARDLRLGVVAEGVEDLVTHQALVDLGCDSAQGWYYARPAAGDAITAWLQDRTVSDVHLHASNHGPNLGSFYDLLAVPRRATLDEIAAAYGQSMRAAVTAGNLALVARLRVAYETLTNPALRASYDRALLRKSDV